MLGALRERTKEELDDEEGAVEDPLRRAPPSAALRRYTPPRFASEVTQGIRHGAAKLFKVAARHGPLTATTLACVCTGDLQCCLALRSPVTTVVSVQELGLRDYARIDGWVLFPFDTPGMGSEDAGDEGVSDEDRPVETIAEDADTVVEATTDEIDEGWADAEPLMAAMASEDPSLVPSSDSEVSQTDAYLCT